MRQTMSTIFWLIKKYTWEDQARRHDLSTVETHSETQRKTTGTLGFLPDLHCLEGPCYPCLWVWSLAWSEAVPSGQSVKQYGIYPAFSYRKKKERKERKKERKRSGSVVSDSLQPHGL